MQYFLVLDLSLAIRERWSKTPFCYLQHIQMPWSDEDSRFIPGYTPFEPDDGCLNASDSTVRTDD